MLWVGVSNAYIEDDSRFWSTPFDDFFEEYENDWRQGIKMNALAENALYIIDITTL
ncbi:MAG: hypothetical protein J07HQW2_03764 [Haloquadratum walsbyi J07HQW2]|jgi:hypothetical protein|uniref:Uncharacterized protein n=1 Tax=Haloquadratum walsbyi J07HQW2 TaxID=1238425 RepID=U1NJY7_9EURY|nr:MAG: hypothetical protein J07HQW2_03764 [Haloquadratum walsbyi J07HQW2]